MVSPAKIIEYGHHFNQIYAAAIIAKFPMNFFMKIIYKLSNKK
jgi:hypothetical protein